eukprot:1208130-Amphidinium_carterae.2
MAPFQLSNDTYNDKIPMLLLCWRQTMPERLGKSHANRHYRRAEDIAIEYNPVYIGTYPRDIHIRALLSVTIQN